MIRCVLLGMIGFGIVTSAATGQEKGKPPVGPSPLFATVTAVDKQKGVVELVEVQTKFSAFMVIVEEVVDGMLVKAPKTVYQPVTSAQRKVLTMTTAEVNDGTGKKLDKEEVWKRLAVGKTIVISADGRPVDAAYLKIMTPETPVIVSMAYVMAPPAPDAPVPFPMPGAP